MPILFSLITQVKLGNHICMLIVPWVAIVAYVIAFNIDLVNFVATRHYLHELHFESMRHIADNYDHGLEIIIDNYI